MKSRLLIIFILLAGLLISAAQYPRPQGWVNDFAGVLSDSTEARLTDWFTEVKQKTGVEVAIATFPDLGGKDYQDYATALFREWGVGNKDDEGVLILLALKERKIKIEVGYGSEGYLTDAGTNQRAYQVMRKLLPEGKENFDLAFEQASLALMNDIAKEKGVALTGVPEFQGTGGSKPGGAGTLVLIIIFIFLMIITRGRILWWILLFSNSGGGSGGFGGWGGSGGRSSGGFGGFGGFGGGRSGGGGAGGGF